MQACRLLWMLQAMLQQALHVVGPFPCSHHPALAPIQAVHAACAHVHPACTIFPTAAALFTSAFAEVATEQLQGGVCASYSALTPLQFQGRCSRALAPPPALLPTSITMCCCVEAILLACCNLSHVNCSFMQLFCCCKPVRVATSTGCLKIE